MDDDLFPINMDLIEENLYLGSYSTAADPRILKKYKITHILTINDYPLPDSIMGIKNLTIKFINLPDYPESDLLSHFTDTDAFITEGLSNGAVLVHCFLGVSRSAATVIAHIMKKYKLPYEEAYLKVRDRRSVVDPNEGFMSQLRLYEEIGYNVDISCKKYKMYRLKNAADKMYYWSAKKPANLDLIAEDPENFQKPPETQILSCRKCDRILATESNLINHIFDGDVCTKVYSLEPVSWMNVTEVIKDKLICPQCTAEVGEFSWGGKDCPCGFEVYPAFCLEPSEVNFTKN